MPPLPRAVCRCGACRRPFGEPLDSAFFDARTGMAAFSIDILVYELPLTIRNRAARMVLCCAPGRSSQQLKLYVGAWLRPLMKPARFRCSCCPAPVNRSIRSCACCGWAAAAVMPAVYMVASSQPGGSEPDRVHAFGADDLGRLRAPDRAPRLGRRQFAHRGRAVRENPEAGGNLVGDAELLKDICHVNSGGRGLGIGHEDRVGGQQSLAQVSGILDG